MEIPELIDIINKQVLCKYREIIEQEDLFIFRIVDEDKAMLDRQLNEEQKNYCMITFFRWKTSSNI